MNPPIGENLDPPLGGGPGAPGANHSGTARCGGVTDFIVCIHLRLTLTLPQQHAIVVICSLKAVSAHL